MKTNSVLIVWLWALLSLSSEETNTAQTQTERTQRLRISPNGQTVSQPSSTQFVVTCRGVNAEPNFFTNIRFFDPRNEEINDIYSRDKNPDIRVEELQLGVLLLHFLKPNPDQSGVYTCSATFQHSDHMTESVKIAFYEDVQWDDCPDIQALVRDQSGQRIRCRASANPKPNIQWMKEGMLLTDKSDHLVVDSNGIRVNGKVEASDSGIYRVRALVTETGKIHDKYITVQIFVKPEISSSVADHFEGVESESATLQCKASGSPEPVFTWFDPNKRNLSAVGGYSVDRNSGTLLIHKVRTQHDNGVFTCMADNSAGSAEKSVRLSVVIRPEITSFMNQSFDAFQSSLLECRARGEPKPSLKIRKDLNSREFIVGDARVTFEEFEEREEKVLKMFFTKTERKDDGLYYCAAENRAARVERVGHLEVRFAPDLSRTPFLSVKTWSLHAINISCLADAIPNATIKWFFRGNELLSNSEDSVYKIVDNGAGLSTIFVNPLQGREVFGQYRCLAFNSLGQSELSIQLDQAFRPGTILQINHKKITPKTVHFQLFGPTFDGGLPIKKIRVQYREDQNQWSDGQWRTKQWPFTGQLTTDHESQQYFLDGLKPRTRYVFRFAAENDVGLGDFSPEKVLITSVESRPDTPVFHNLPFDDVITKTEVVSPFPDRFVSSWSMPEDNGRQIKYFELTYYSVRKELNGFERVDTAHEQRESVSVTDQSMTAYTLTRLKPNTYYRLELRANNELGFSDPALIVFRTAVNGSASEEWAEPSLLSSSTVGVVAGIIVVVVVTLLVITDLYFYFRYKVGSIYFLKTHVFSNAHLNRDKSARQMVESLDNPVFESDFRDRKHKQELKTMIDKRNANNRAKDSVV